MTANSSLDPHTDGTWIAYDHRSVNGQDAQEETINFQPVAGGTERQLSIPGIAFAFDPHISQGVISFWGRTALGLTYDIFVYVVATNTLYQVTSTPTVNDTLSDVSVLANGDIRVVWGANDGLAGDYNVYATTFTPAGVHYEICPLYDSSVAKKSGGAYP